MRQEIFLGLCCLSGSAPSKGLSLLIIWRSKQLLASSTFYPCSALEVRKNVPPWEQPLHEGTSYFIAINNYIVAMQRTDARNFLENCLGFSSRALLSLHMPPVAFKIYSGVSLHPPLAVQCYGMLFM